MIIKQPDCLLKEYLAEINNWYKVTITIGQFSIILKELGIRDGHEVSLLATRLVAREPDLGPARLASRGSLYSWVT